MAIEKMWGGRFKVSTDDLVQEYTQSLEYDHFFAQEDIEGSKAHVRMLAKQGILDTKEVEKILQGLDHIAEEIRTDQFVWSKDLEDVHMNIEHRLTQLVGNVGQKLHTGRSRNDQVALDFRLYIAKRLSWWAVLILDLIQILASQAREHQAVLLPGYTHLQPAQPISLAQHLLAYVQMFERDFERIEDSLKRIRVSPLGAAALAGTTYPLDPEQVAEELGLDGIFKNSMDAVADRDFVLEALFVGAVIMTHLSRLCEELIVWANPNFGFVFLPDGFATGSSIMPQKKNPDVAELMRGRSGRTHGNLMAMFTLLKGLPLAYNRDLQEDKPLFLEVDKVVAPSLEIMAQMIAALRFNAKQMYAALRLGYLNATEFADYLAKKGVPFRQAHRITGEAVAYAEAREKGLEELSLEELRKFSELVDQDVYQVLDYREAVARRNTPGGTGFESVERQLEEVENWVRKKKVGGSV